MGIMEEERVKMLTLQWALGNVHVQIFNISLKSFASLLILMLNNCLFSILLSSNIFVDKEKATMGAAPFQEQWEDWNYRRAYGTST